MHCNGDILRNQSTFQFSSNKIPICLITNLKRVDKHPRSVVLTDDGLWPLLKLFVKRMHNTCTRFMSWNGHWRSCSESPCDKLVITLTRDAYGKYNSRALTRTQVIFPVIITWSCYNYHILLCDPNMKTHSWGPIRIFPPIVLMCSWPETLVSMNSTKGPPGPPNISQWNNFPNLGF